MQVLRMVLIMLMVTISMFVFCTQLPCTASDVVTQLQGYAFYAAPLITLSAGFCWVSHTDRCTGFPTY